VERQDAVDAVGGSDDDLEVFDLDGGRTLLIRPTTADDAERLDSLYLALDPSDLRKRFFTAWSPGGRWSRTWAAVGERGGYGVIAIALDRRPSATGADETVVGEAGYTLRHDGDGDLAVTVHPDWRGWLGAYLVDRLVVHAASAGIMNLQADVLLENAAMRRVFAHRGAVVLDHEHGTEHVSISTVGRVPSWPPDDRRRRVLVETAGGWWEGEDAADEADVAVAICAGPRRRRIDCPVLTGGRCPLADEADAIVVLLDPDDEMTRDVIEAHGETNPATPVFIRRSKVSNDRCQLSAGAIEADVATILEAASGPDDASNPC
jgi:RimJ/RimL family protein N-acetyltransferase